jgi:predicted acylesterase/phospholipase RssA
MDAQSCRARVLSGGGGRGAYHVGVQGLLEAAQTAFEWALLAKAVRDGVS